MAMAAKRRVGTEQHPDHLVANRRIDPHAAEGTKTVGNLARHLNVLTRPPLPVIDEIG